MGNQVPIVNHCRYYIHLRGQRSELFHVKDHSANDNSSLNEVKSANGKIIDVTQVPGGYSITLKVCRAKGVKNEVAWKKLQKRGTRFDFEVVEVGGAVELYQRCVVGGVNRTASDSGEVSHDVSIGSVEMEETE